jgi:hypothetical protein
MIVAAIYPFIRVRRNGRIWSSFFICWGLNVVSAFLFIFCIPLMVYPFDEPLAHKISTSLPDGPAVIEMAFFGWFYAGITVLLALFLKRVGIGISRHQKPPQ